MFTLKHTNKSNFLIGRFFARFDDGNPCSHAQLAYYINSTF